MDDVQPLNFVLSKQDSKKVYPNHIGIIGSLNRTLDHWPVGETNSTRRLGGVIQDPLGHDPWYPESVYFRAFRRNAYSGTNADPAKWWSLNTTFMRQAYGLHPFTKIVRLPSSSLAQQNPGNVLAFSDLAGSVSRIVTLHCVNTLDENKNSDVLARVTLVDHDVAMGATRFYDHEGLFGGTPAAYGDSLGAEVCTYSFGVQGNDLKYGTIQSSTKRLVFFPTKNLHTGAGFLKGLEVELISTAAPSASVFCDLPLGLGITPIKVVYSQFFSRKYVYVLSQLDPKMQPSSSRAGMVVSAVEVVGSSIKSCVLLGSVLATDWAISLIDEPHLEVTNFYIILSGKSFSLVLLDRQKLHDMGWSIFGSGGAGSAGTGANMDEKRVDVALLGAMGGKWAIIQKRLLYRVFTF